MSQKLFDGKEEENTFSVNCTCCNITYIPNPQAIFLSPKGVDKGQIRAT